MIVGKSRCRTRPPSQDYSTECSFSASSQRRLWFLCMWNTKMPTVAILGTRKLHYESKQEIDVVSKKLFGISRDGHTPSRCSQLVECRNRTNDLSVTWLKCYLIPVA